MKILLTGVTGYIGKRLLPLLVEQGHHVICCVRDESSFNPPVSLLDSIEILQCDLSDKRSLDAIPSDIDAAYYLVHSMSSSSKYVSIEKKCAINFREAVNKTKAKQVIYMSGIANSTKLSKHLSSRKNVEEELRKGSYALPH